ncbi:hypothetical protein RCOM_0354020 [Ricinus communis]|uniref:Uncharacterized protein n=1 Tax=Ricinus communis TaxID=3988 RepID=B9T6P8_RICCO|nr:hypothetical protein RCOM_0354020 [Ricinus communis]
MATEYLELPLIPPSLQPGNHKFTNGVNFASGGAGALVGTYQGMVIDLNSQLSYFKNLEKQLKQKLGSTKTKALYSKAIYIFSIGSNDYAEPFLTTPLYFSTTPENSTLGWLLAT